MKNEENQEIKIVNYAPFWKNPIKILHFIYYFSTFVSLILLFFLFLVYILLLTQDKLYFAIFYAHMGFFMLMIFILLAFFIRTLSIVKKQKLKNIVIEKNQGINQVVKLGFFKEPLVFHSLMAFLGTMAFPFTISIAFSYLDLNWFEKTLNIIFGYGIFNILSLFFIIWRLIKMDEWYVR